MYHTIIDLDDDIPKSSWRRKMVLLFRFIALPGNFWPENSIRNNPMLNILVS